MPPRIRLAVKSWERVWWLTLANDVQRPERLKSLVDQFVSENVSIRAQMRTRRRLCVAINTKDLDESSEFELTMMLMAYLERELGAIERVEDRPSTIWPYLEYDN